MLENNINEIFQHLSELESEVLTDSGIKTLNRLKGAVNTLKNRKCNSVIAKTMDGKKLRVVDISEPYLINTDGRNIVFYIHKKDRLVITKASLKEVEAKWAKRFIRISRTGLIALDWIKSVGKDITGYKIELKEELGTIEVSRRSYYIIRKELSFL